MTKKIYKCFRCGKVLVDGTDPAFIARALTGLEVARVIRRHYSSSHTSPSKEDTAGPASGVAV